MQHDAKMRNLYIWSRVKLTLNFVHSLDKTFFMMHQGKIPLRITRERMEDNNEMELREILCESVEQIQIAEDFVQ